MNIWVRMFLTHNWQRLRATDIGDAPPVLRNTVTVTFRCLTSGLFTLPRNIRHLQRQSGLEVWMAVQWKYWDIRSSSGGSEASPRINNHPLVLGGVNSSTKATGGM